MWLPLPFRYSGHWLPPSLAPATFLSPVVPGLSPALSFSFQTALPLRQVGCRVPSGPASPVSLAEGCRASPCDPGEGVWG